MTAHRQTRRGFLRTLGAGAAALAVGGAMPAADNATRRKPNFVIILADDMGYGDSSAYGGWIKTPHMEALAAEGLRFTDFHSSGAVCSPTRAGLMTGRYQERAGISGVITANPRASAHWRGLHASEVTFPKVLKKAGYTSALFGKWHLGYAKTFNPMHHGFDRFHGYVSGNIDYISHYDRMGVYDWWEGLEHTTEPGYVTHLITRHAVKFIEDHKDRPFCLYVANEAVHSPLQAPGDPAQRGPDRSGGAKGPRRDRKETYRLMMKAMDDGIGQVVAKIKQLGLEKDTLVFFFSDNGATPMGSNAPLRGFKGSVWEGGHREPAIAWWPGRIKPSTTTDQLSICLDLMPTMIDLAGAEMPPGRKLDGVSLAPVLAGKTLGGRKLFWRGQAMRDGQWKLVVGGKGSQGTGLYDLSRDIGEKTDLADKHPDRVKRMLAEIEAWKKNVAAGATPQPAPPPGATDKKAPKKRNNKKHPPV